MGEKRRRRNTDTKMVSNTQASTPSAERSQKHDRKMVIVVGAESSGNRLIFNTLKSAWNYLDDETKMAEWWDDSKKINCDVDRITFRSLPHGGIGNGRHFVNPSAFGESAMRAGYDVRFVVTTRDKNIVQQSKTGLHCLGDAGMAANEMVEARRVLGRLIFAHGERCFLWNYETFMWLQGDYLQALYRWLGIEASEYPKLHDGNVKYILR